MAVGCQVQALATEGCRLLCCGCRLPALLLALASAWAGVHAAELSRGVAGTVEVGRSLQQLHWWCAVRVCLCRSSRFAGLWSLVAAG